jgi:hypothetical protein
MVLCIGAICLPKICFAVCFVPLRHVSIKKYTQPYLTRTERVF